LDSRAIARYFVLYRLSQRGYLASPARGRNADIVVCTEDASRVALLRVRVLHGGGVFGVATAPDERPSRNTAYVFVELDDLKGDGPVCFVVPSARVAREIASDARWPGGSDALAEHHEAWHVLGLERAGRARSSSWSSPSASPISPI